jgi:valyl-tRNA synthetase
LIKPRLQAEGDSARIATKNLVSIFEASLRLLSPFMPFITEEIWHKLPGAPGSIMVAAYPAPDPALDHPAAEAEMALVMESIVAIRNMRAEMNVPPSAQVSVLVFSQEPGLLRGLEAHQQSVRLQARVQDLQFQPEGGPPAAAAKSVVMSPEGGSLDLVMPLAGLIDFKEEARRLNREMDKLSRELAQVQKKLANEDFLAKARPDVVERERERLQTLNEKLTKLKSHEKRLKGLLAK